MNETRKKIIELIEPYMEKELSFGCIIEHNLTKKQEVVIESVWKYHTTLNFYANCEKEDIEKSWTIIWHYDITAVMKYIKRKWIFTLPHWIDNIYFRDEFIDKEYSIPNKPLNLYSEEEEKNLLELLQSP